MICMHTRDFVAECRNINVTPHVAQNTKRSGGSAIDGRSQHRALTLSPEGCELKAESGILHRNASMTAHQESNESKNRQKEAWHGVPIVRLYPVPSQPVTGGRNNGEQQPLAAKSYRLALKPLDAP